MKTLLLSFIVLLLIIFQVCLVSTVEDERDELGIWNKVDELPETQTRRIKRCYCGGYGSYGYGGGYPSYGGGYGYGFPYGGGFGGGMPYGYGSPFGGFYG